MTTTPHHDDEHQAEREPTLGELAWQLFGKRYARLSVRELHQLADHRRTRRHERATTRSAKR